jgi:hypothetical protein
MSLAVAAARRAGVRDSVAASPRDDDDGVDDHGDRNGLEDYGHGAVAHREESSGSAPPTSIMPLDMIMMHVQISSTSASQFLATHRRFSVNMGRGSDGNVSGVLAGGISPRRSSPHRQVRQVAP